MLRTVTCLNPFPGLRPFQQNEAHLFFGREDQTHELLCRLRHIRFLAVVGTSGGGKSSLVRAGLLPSLYGGDMTQAGSAWRVALLRPDSDPIGNLAQALNQPDVLGSNAEEAAIERIFIETTLRRGDLGLIEVVKQAKLPDNENLLIVVDQFEELFRFKDNSPKQDSGDEAAAFVKLLLEATKQEKIPIYVVLTMRSHYLGDCAKFRDLPEAINKSQYLIPRMTREQRRAAIVRPVAVGKAEITPPLVNRLLNDLGDEPDQLPILQHALMRIWEYWKDNHKDREPIDFQHYEAIGGMKEALSRHADEIYEDLPKKLGSGSQKIAEKLFKCLTDKGPYNRGIRRPTKLKEVCAIACAEEQEVIAVVDEFRGSNRSFLMPPKDVELEADSVIDISHESLMRVWQRLKDWVDEEWHSAQEYRRLAQTAARFQKGDAGLWDDPDLAIAWKWYNDNQPNEAWAKRYAPNFKQAIDFLQESKKARDREIAQKESLRRQKEEIELQKRQRRILILALISTSIGLIFAISFGVIASIESHKALRDNIKAHSATSELLSASNQEFDALLEGIKAGRQLKRIGWNINAETKSQVVSALLQAVYWIRERNRLEGHNDAVFSVSFSPNGKTLASASADNTVKLWLSDGRLLKTLTGHTEPVYQVVFSSDGKMLASASADKTVKLWQSDGTLLANLKGHRERVWDVSFSSDGKMLASASEDNTVKLWLSDGTLLRTLTGHGDRVWDVRFSPDSKMLASASGDGTVKLWKTDGTLLRTLTGHTGDVYRVDFTPDGQKLVSSSADNTVKLWQLDGTLLTTLSGHRDGVIGISFLPNGRTLASASYDKTIKLWQLDNNLLTVLKGHKGWVYSVSFSPNGETVASSSRDNTVKIWQRDGTLLATLKGHNDTVSSVSFSPDGQTLASASYDKTIKLWKPDGTLLKTFIGHSALVSDVSFSPDGQTLASASYDKTIRLWKPDGTLLKTLEGHSQGVLSVSFSPDRQMLASASADNTVKIWKSDGELLKTLTGHNNQVLSVSFSPDSKMVASASADNTVKLWRIDGTLLKTFQGHEGWVTGVSFSRDGETLASASRDKTVKLWRLDGTLITTLKGHGDGVLDVSFSPARQTLASASIDKKVILWNLPNNLDNQLLDDLLRRGCHWMRDYLRTSSNDNEKVRQLCQGL